MQQTPASFYGGDAFKIDTSAATNFYIKRQNEQRAKETALDKYYKNLTSKSTNVGMRPQEDEAFQQSLRNYKNFYNAHASEIASGRSPELADQAEQLAALPFTIAAKSKARFAKDNMVQTIRGANADMADRWTDDTWDKFKKSTESAYVINDDRSVTENPNSYDFNPMDIAVNPKKIDLTKQWDDEGKGIEVAEEQTDKPDDIDPQFTIQRTITSKPTLVGLATVGTRADANWNKETQFTFAKTTNFEDYKAHPEKFMPLLESFQKVYPNKPIENDKDLYIATSINIADKTTPKTQLRLRDEKKWSSWNRAENARVAREDATFRSKLTAQQNQSTNNARTFFEEIPNGTYDINGGGKAVKNGDGWYDTNGKPLTALGDKTVRITGNLPQGFTAGVTNSKLKLGVDYMDLHVEKGRAIGGYNEITKYVPRRDAVVLAAKGTGQKVQLETVSPLIQDNDPNKIGF